MNHIRLYGNRPERSIVKLSPPRHTRKLVASYVVSEDGLTILNPIPEFTARRPMDGKACEIGNLLLGALPEQLVQMDNTLDPMTRAEKITSAAVRRFGKLEEQRKNLVESLKNEE